MICGFRGNYGAHRHSSSHSRLRRCRGPNWEEHTGLSRAKEAPRRDPTGVEARSELGGKPGSSYCRQDKRDQCLERASGAEVSGVKPSEENKEPGRGVGA